MSYEIVVPKGYFLMSEDKKEILIYPGNSRRTPCVVLKMVTFQATLTFKSLDEKRIQFLDEQGFEWSVFISQVSTLIPRMVKGAVRGHWRMTKKGAMLGLVWLGDEHITDTVAFNQDLPLLLRNFPLELVKDQLEHWEGLVQLESLPLPDLG